MNLFLEKNIVRSKMKDKDVDGLMKALGDEPEAHPPQMRDGIDEGAGKAAALALGRIGDNSVVDELIKLLEDKRKHVVMRAIWALAGIGDKRAIKPIIYAIRGLGDYSRDMTARVLEGAISEKTLDSIVEALDDDETDFKTGAVWLLGRLKYVKAVDSVIQLLKDKDEDVRLSAIWALGEIKDQAAVDPLLEIMQSDENVRPYAATAIDDIGKKVGIKEIVKALKDKGCYDLWKNSFIAPQRWRLE